MNYQMLITGKRVYIREYDKNDFQKFYKLSSDPEMRKLSVFSTPKDIYDSKKEFKIILDDQKKQNRKRFIMGAFLKINDIYIGDVGFEILKQNQIGGIAEIGYFIDKSQWGKGYATEIAGLLIDHCFTKYKFHKVIASCDKRNTASEKVMIKCGMKKEGEFKKQRFKNNQWFDELKYGILKEEWLKK